MQDGLTQEKLSDALELSWDGGRWMQNSKGVQSWMVFWNILWAHSPLDLCATHIQMRVLPSLVYSFPGYFYMAKVQPSSFLLSGDRSYLQESLLWVSIISSSQWVILLPSLAPQESTAAGYIQMISPWNATGYHPGSRPFLLHPQASTHICLPVFLKPPRIQLPFFIPDLEWAEQQIRCYS